MMCVSLGQPVSRLPNRCSLTTSLALGPEAPVHGTANERSVLVSRNPVKRLYIVARKEGLEPVLNFTPPDLSCHA
jgi:hypothetical protein